MTNFIITDVAGLGVLNSVKDSKRLNNNFKSIHLSKSSQEPHLKYLSTEPKATKEFRHEVDMWSKK